MKNKIKRERWTKYNFKALKTIYKNLINNKVQHNTNKKETIIRKTEYPCCKIASLKQLDLYSTCSKCEFVCEYVTKQKCHINYVRGTTYVFTRQATLIFIYCVHTFKSR